MAVSEERGRTYYAGVTTFVDRDKCVRFLHSQPHYTELQVVDVEQFRMKRKLVINSSALTAASETMLRQLLSGGTSIPDPPMGMRRDDLEYMMRAFVRDAQRVAFTYGVAFLTCSMSEDPFLIALEPDDLIVSVANINSNERVYLVESKLPYKSPSSGSGSGSLGTTMSLARQRRKRHKFPFVITFEDSVFLNQTREFVTALDSLQQIENFTNSALAAAVKADARRSDPSAALIQTAPTAVDQKVMRDMSYSGSGADVKLQRASDNASMAALQFEFMHQMDAMAALLAETRRRTQEVENRNAPKQVDEVTGGPKYKNAVIADTRKEPIPVGYTVVGLPAAAPPPHLIPTHDVRRESAGEVSGVPPALFGGTRSPVAVNQMVLSTFMATLESRRVVLVPLCQAVFYETFKDKMIEYEIKERLEKSLTKRRRTGEPDDESQQPGAAATFEWTKGRLNAEEKEQKEDDLKMLREKYLLKIDFCGFADPLMTERMYASDMINEEALVTFTAAYSGLSKNNFDLARMKESRQQSQKLKELTIKQEELKVKLLQADLQMKLSQAAGAGSAAAGAANPKPTAAAAAAAAAAAVASAGIKRKATTQLEPPSVDTGLAKFGPGKTAGTGKLSSKVHHQTRTGSGNSKQKPHVKRSS